MVGFRPGQALPDGSWVVRGRDALAWPEVYFTGQGWVAFDPTPASHDAGGPDENTKRQVLNRLGIAPTTAPSATPAVVPPLASAPAATPAAGGTGRGGWSGWPVVAAGVVFIGVLLVLYAARVVRRMRHRRAGPRGAWSEVLDLLVLLGRPAPGWRPAPWIAADLAVRVPATPAGAAHPAVRLAEYADRASFAPELPSDRAWPEVRRLRRAVRRAVPLRRRCLWPVDPRPLVRR